MPGEEQSWLDKRQKELVVKVRVQGSRSPTPSLLIVDAQSVKNADTAAEKGYEVGNRVSGIKRHLVVDSQGFPHGSLVTTANVTDREGALEIFQGCAESLQTVSLVLVDGSYSGAPFASSVFHLIGATVQVAKRPELHPFVVIPTRWVVGRSF